MSDPFESIVNFLQPIIVRKKYYRYKCNTALQFKYTSCIMYMFLHCNENTILCTVV